VRVLDIDKRWPDWICADAMALPTRSALLLARRSGRPLGSVVVPVDGGVISVAERERGLCRLMHHWGDDVLAPYPPGRLGSGGTMALRTTLARRLGGFDPDLGRRYFRP